MIEIRTLERLSSSYGMFPPGMIVTAPGQIPERVAEVWVAAGVAEFVSPPSPPSTTRFPQRESAVALPPEHTADVRTPSPKTMAVHSKKGTVKHEPVRLIARRKR